MTPKLSSEQRKALENQRDGPVYVIDTETQAEYVLLPVATYKKVKALIGDDTFDIRDTYPLQDRVAASAGWDDPAMDDYNEYDAHRAKQ